MANALQTFFGKDAYSTMTNESVLKSYRTQCVDRPAGWLGGGEISNWLKEHIGVDNHCWLSVHDRGSHLFFMTPGQAQQFREYLAQQQASAKSEPDQHLMRWMLMFCDNAPGSCDFSVEDIAQAAAHYRAGVHPWESSDAIVNSRVVNIRDPAMTRAWED